ncbi:MAG: iron-containing alcohol dehydrogenase [Thermodesulfobacteriota bacterium]
MNFDKRYVVTPEECRRLCTCGRPHPPADVKQYSGPMAMRALAEDARRAGRSILMIDDEMTHAAAGSRVEEFFREMVVPHQVLTFSGRISANEERVDQVIDRSRRHGLIVSVGAGTINDLGKFAATKRGLPFWTAPTAPSMNGYTSAIAAIKVAGVKRTLPASPPEFIYNDPDVIRHAPLDLRQAGYCDVMAKSVSDIDWRIESLLFSGSYCSLPASIVVQGESGFRDYPEKIQAGDPEAIQALQNGLLASGISMLLAGSSAPASGGEHLFSHFLDMREPLTGRTPKLHGWQVAAGIVLSAASYKNLAALDRADLKHLGETAYDRDFKGIRPTWGETAAEVEKRFDLKRPQLLQLEKLLPPNWEKIQRLCGQVRGPEYYLHLFRRTGFPLTLDSLDLSEDEFLLAALSARTIRERLTVLDLAAQLGVLEQTAHEVAALLQPAG